MWSNYDRQQQNTSILYCKVGQTSTKIAGRYWHISIRWCSLQYYIHQYNTTSISLVHPNHHQDCCARPAFSRRKSWLAKTLFVHLNPQTIVISRRLNKKGSTKLSDCLHKGLLYEIIHRDALDDIYHNKDVQQDEEEDSNKNDAYVLSFNEKKNKATRVRMMTIKNENRNSEPFKNLKWQI